MDDITIIDIDDRPILAAGCPPEDDAAAQTRWHGSVIRHVVDLIRDSHPKRPWDYIRDALDTWSRHVQTEVLTAPEFLNVMFSHSHPDTAALQRGCPPADLPKAQRRWAQSMTLAFAGDMIINKPDIDATELRRALASITTYIRSDNGPLTWETGR